jgi:hypothetical protein
MAGRGRKGQDSKPDLGEPAVRGLSGGLGKRGHGGNVNPPRNRKGESGTPPPTTERARALSQPWRPMTTQVQKSNQGQPLEFCSRGPLTEAIQKRRCVQTTRLCPNCRQTRKLTTRSDDFLFARDPQSRASKDGHSFQFRHADIAALIGR